MSVPAVVSLTRAAPPARNMETSPWLVGTGEAPVSFASWSTVAWRASSRSFGSPVPAARAVRICAFSEAS